MDRRVKCQVCKHLCHFLDPSGSEWVCVTEFMRKPHATWEVSIGSRPPATGLLGPACPRSVLGEAGGPGHSR